MEPPVTQYTLDGLYPNSLYQIWVAAKSKRGEGATTPALSVRTEQYCKLTDKKTVFILYTECSRIFLSSYFYLSLYYSKAPFFALLTMSQV